VPYKSELKVASKLQLQYPDAAFIVPILSERRIKRVMKNGRLHDQSIMIRSVAFGGFIFAANGEEHWLKIMHSDDVKSALYHYDENAKPVPHFVEVKSLMVEAKKFGSGRKPLRLGDKVRIKEGPFEGKLGTVTHPTKNEIEIEFNKNIMRIRIDPFLLEVV
jgi:transcription antitermination factor NusG